MKKKDNKHFEAYKKLVKKIDQHTESLEDFHKKHMKCRNGCDLCCIDFSIFPVEYYFMLNETEKINSESETENKSASDTCAFLKNHSCTIYNQRPIMCRTHGLPLIYANDDGEFELSTCELNFTEFDFEVFTIENTLPQDKYNSKLYLLNKAFIAEYKDKKYNETDLISMRELAEQIKNKKQVS